MLNKLTVIHGSQQIIEKPVLVKAIRIMITGSVSTVRKALTSQRSGRVLPKQTALQINTN